MINIKSKTELEKMRIAGRITGGANTFFHILQIIPHRAIG